MTRRQKVRVPAAIYRRARLLFEARPHLASRIRAALPLAVHPERIDPVYRTTLETCRCADTFFRRPYWIPYRLPCKHRIALWLRGAITQKE